MGLPNLIFQGKIPRDVLDNLGTPTVENGLYSMAGEGNIRRWHVKPGYARAYIHSYVEELGDFGSYTATFSHVGKCADARVSGHSHPHFYHGLCWGNLSAPRDHALDRQDIEAVAGLISIILNSYNPDDAFDGWWKHKEINNEMRCVSCGDEYGILVTCPSCQSYVCEHCRVRCLDAQRRHVGRYFCKMCVTDKLCIGEGCEFTECWNHPWHDRHKQEPEQKQEYVQASFLGEEDGQEEYDDLPF